MTLKEGLLAGGVALVVSICVVLSAGGGDGKDGRDGRDGVTVGSVPVLTSPIVVDGVAVHWKAQPVKQATTTVCSFRTPNGTTTGQVFVKLRSSPNASHGYQMAWDRGSNTATTTDLGSFTDGDGISTADVVFPPNVYVNVKVASTTGVAVGSEFNPTGDCTLRLTQFGRESL